MAMRSILAVLFLAATALATEVENFDGHVVIRFTPQTEKQLKTAVLLQQNNPQMDFWIDPASVGRKIDLRLSPQQFKYATKRLTKAGIEYETIIEDVGRLVREERSRLAKNTMGWTNWTDYQELEEIEVWLTEKAAAYEFVTLESIGKSFEGRDLWLMRINKENSAGNDKKVVVIDASIHAREWITAASLTWIIEQLLENDKYEDVLQNFDFHIVPVLNPDGLEYSHRTNRMWRKTRSDFGNRCIGTDPNRNWDFQFGGPGTSTDSCSEIYTGPFAFSEPECKAYSEYIEERKDIINIYMTMHSYSQLILFPYGYTNIPAEDYDDMKALGLKGEAAIEGVFNTDWETGSPGEILYLNSGSSRDWAKGAAGLKYSFTFELRDQGQYGFILPPEQILPGATEIFEGILAILDGLLEESE